MLKWYFNLLPVWMVKIVARKHCEVICVEGSFFHEALEGVLIKAVKKDS